MQPWAVPLLLDPGKHTMHVTWQIKATLGRQRQSAVTWQRTFETPITVSPPSPDAIDFITDGSSAQQVLDAVRITTIGIENAVPLDNYVDVIGHIEVDPLDFAAMFDFEFTDGTNTLGLAVGVANKSRFHFRLRTDQPRPETIVCVIRPCFPSVQIPFGSKLYRDRPLWAGPPLRITALPIKWSDRNELERLDKTIQAMNNNLEDLIEQWHRDND
jgi:hypothetical protein